MQCVIHSLAFGHFYLLVIGQGSDRATNSGNLVEVLDAKLIQSIEKKYPHDVVGRVASTCEIVQGT